MARLWEFFSGAVRKQKPPKICTAITVHIEGIIGGGNGRARVRYRLFSDVSTLRASLPDVWVLTPDDSAIRHVNIWRSTYHGAHCARLNRALPMFCWGSEIKGRWQRFPTRSRLLEPFLGYVTEFLSKENEGSRARA
jgi:hypothetical protein